MSYQNAAEAVRSRGRGEDTMLVHMTPGEVKGLQQLAMANGGSLTINPDTGLPEAGFLKSLLPTLIGVGLAATGIGAPMAGLMVGGFEAMRTGDIGKGLMAGLGAYGGAGLASGLQSAGAAAGKQAATQGAEAALYDQALGGTAVAPAAYTAPTTVGGRLAEMGSGFSNLMGTAGTAGSQAAATTAATNAGITGTGLATKGLAAAAGPMLEPAPMPEVEEYDYNYEGPYKPTKREVTYPGADRDPTDSSEFLYFRDSNPYPGFETATASSNLPPIDPNAPTFAGVPVELATDPERMKQYQDAGYFAEGGVTKAPASYVAGRDAEFNYGFQPMANVQPVQPQNQGLNSIQIGPGTGFAATNLTGAQHTQLMLDQFKNHPKFGPQLRAAGYAEGGPTAAAPPEGYVPGQSAEFNYGFQPMAAQVPEIQQEAAAQNALVSAPVNTGGDGGSDYLGRGTPINRVNTQLPAEVRQNLADRIRAEQLQRATAAAAIASGASPSEGGNWQGNETPDGGGYETVSGAGSYSGDIDRSEAYFRMGGKTMDHGGFVIDAHTVSEIGNGSSDAGHAMLARIGGEPIKGAGDGTSDSIRANIGGVQEARIAKDENYFSKEDVKRLGGGNYKKGEKKLYALMKKAHESRKKNGRGQASGLDKLVTRMA